MKLVLSWAAAIACALCLAADTAAGADIQRTFTIREPFGVAWGPDRVKYRVEFPEGQVAPAGVGLKDVAGKAVAAQLSEITFWPDKQTVKSAMLSFMATLAPDEPGQWTMTAGRTAVSQPATDLGVREHGDRIELTTAKVGIRVLGSTRTFAAPQSDAAQLPAPIQAMRLAGDRWIGRGWWQTDRPCLGYAASVEQRGPVFARVALRYDFADNTSYKATIELSAGHDMAVVSEAFDLSAGRRYEMPELTGVKPGDKFQYVEPRFASADEALMWDWWCQTHGLVPSPNCYCFSFYQGLQPDSCQWSGRMYHEAAKPGDGGLKYDKDGRVISINAYLQWGQDETLYFGAYSSKGGADEVAIVALRPSQWLHPDIDPHPISTLKQYTQTNNLWIERREAGDLFLRAPACLGKRVYGIGVVQRREMADAAGKPSKGSEIMLRHVRLGRLELDRVRQWPLDYPETSKYPRLFVDPGDLGSLGDRVQKNLDGLGHLRWVQYLKKLDPATGRKLVEECIAALQTMTRKYATEDYGHMNYAIQTGVLAHQADVALAVPEITPQERALILRLVAANLYNSLSPDYVPPREAGFAWGSANMMSQLRSRGGLMAALLPGCPEGPKIRRELVHWLTGYIESQVSPAGALLECPHYGGMAIELGVVPLVALSRAGGVDLSAAMARYRAAARVRLGTLLPWDVRGGFRSTPPIGDGYYDGDGTLGLLAALFERSDPQLARELWWGVQESGRALGGHPTPTGLLVNPDLVPSPPRLGSEHYAGMGFVFRNGFPRRDEAFCLVTAGSHSVGHGHNDRGAFILYAKGAPLAVDFAAMYTPSIGEAWEHPGGLSFDHDESGRRCPGRDKPGCYFTGKIWDEHTREPFTCLDPGWDPQARSLDEAFGTVHGFVTLPAADYAAMTRRIAYLNRVPYMLPEHHGKLVTRPHGTNGDDVWVKEPFDWTRRYVFVKSPDPQGPHYLVLRDDLAGNRELKPALNLWCLADKLDVRGPRATYTGQHGVDLDVFVAEPAAFIHRSHSLGHPCGFGFAQNYKKVFGKPFEERQILFQVPQQPGGGGYFVALVPRMHDETPPKFETLAAGNALRVTFPGRTDTVVLRNQPGEVVVDDLLFKGTAFVVSRSANKTSVTMLAPGMVKQGQRVLAEGATAKAVQLR